MTSITASLISLLLLIVPIAFVIMLIIFIYKNYQNTSRLIEQNDEIIALLKRDNKERY